MAEKLVTYIDDKEELFNEILELKDKQKRILLQLKEVKQPYRNVLYKRYIKGKSFVKIADEMHYDFKYTTNLNGIALNEFDKLDKVVEKNGWIKTIKYVLIIIAIVFCVGSYQKVVKSLIKGSFFIFKGEIRNGKWKIFRIM